MIFLQKKNIKIIFLKIKLKNFLVLEIKMKAQIKILILKIQGILLHYFVFANTVFLFYPSFGARLFLFRRIADTGMVNSLQLLNEYGFGILDVTEGDGTFAEVPFCHL